MPRGNPTWIPFLGEVFLQLVFLSTEGVDYLFDASC
jgi:hypothetical protein